MSKRAVLGGMYYTAPQFGVKMRSLPSFLLHTVEPGNTYRPDTARLLFRIKEA